MSNPYIDDVKATIDVIDRMHQRESFKSISEAAFAFAKLQETIDDYREIKAKFEKIYDRMRFTIIPSMLEDEDVTSITVEGVGRIGLTDDINVSVTDRPKFYEWLENEGFESMITETVNAQTLAAFIRKRMREGKELPNDLIAVKPFTRASITRG